MKQKRNHKLIYHFFNNQINCEDVSTIKSISERRKLNRKDLYELVDGNITEVKGWYIKL